MKTNKKRRFTRVTSLFLVFVMMLSMMPMSVFGATDIGKSVVDASGYSAVDCLI